MKPNPIKGQDFVDREGRLNLTGTELLTQIVNNVVITAPNGTNYRITVDNSGNLSTEAV
jgi:hypothetical protein